MPLDEITKITPDGSNAALLDINVLCLPQELLNAFYRSELKLSKREKRSPRFTADNFHVWAAAELRSPRSVWLYYTCISCGIMLVILRAAIRFYDL